MLRDGWEKDFFGAVRSSRARYRLKDSDSVESNSGFLCEVIDKIVRKNNGTKLSTQSELHEAFQDHFVDDEISFTRNERQM